MKNLLSGLMLSGAITLGVLVLPSLVNAQEQSAKEPSGLVFDQPIDLSAIDELTPQILGVTSKIPSPNFRVGENVVVTDDLTGDTYVAGGTVRIDGDVDGDLLVAGGTVTLNGNITEDLRIAGGTVTINGLVGKNVTVVGGTVVFGSKSVVEGNVVGGIGQATFDGAVDGDTYLGAGMFTAGGDFGQDLILQAGEANLLTSTMVGGNLNVTLDEEGKYINEAQITGQTDIKRREMKTSETAAQVKQASKMAGSGLNIVGMLMGLVGGAVLLYAFPKMTKEVAKLGSEQPIEAIAWGFVYLICLPILAIILAITVLGLPIAGLLFLSYLMLMMVAGWLGAYALGMVVASKSKASWLRSNYAQLVAGMLILAVLHLIPMVGGLTSFIAMLVGLGATLKTWRSGYVSPRK